MNHRSRHRTVLETVLSSTFSIFINHHRLKLQTHEEAFLRQLICLSNTKLFYCPSLEHTDLLHRPDRLFVVFYASLFLKLSFKYSFVFYSSLFLLYSYFFSVFKFFYYVFSADWHRRTSYFHTTAFSNPIFKFFSSSSYVLASVLSSLFLRTSPPSHLL